jgi:hypothetical protein
MRQIAFLLLAVATLASVIAYMVPASGQAAQNSAPVYVTKIPSGYRDWRWISSAHEAGNLNSLGAVLGNDVAIKAYREGKLPFPDGTIIAALHYRHLPSDENNKVFGQVQSFVPGPPTNIQFMVKDSKMYAATAAGGTDTSTQTANLATRRYSRLALPATRWLLAILSSRVTRLNDRFLDGWPLCVASLPE